ncbi:MAG TPA: NAD(P)-binding domain-containing protein [Kofleriaceae bacterium]|nr:NAD(P)-binding domain-containing protein [Kofleriaceae bacterium]
MKKIGILGSGKVGEVLGDGFLAHGYPVMRGTREPGKLAAWKAAAKGDAHVGTVAETAKWGDIIVLAVKGTGAEPAIAEAGAANLAGKLVIDATNPIADAPPKNGALTYFTGANESLIGRLQAKVPQARFVKAWNSVGNAVMVNPKLGTTPSMFICGNDPAAKQETTEILAQFGHEAVDVGGVELGYAVEALCILWCAPGFLRNDWVHAFKYLKP